MNLELGNTYGAVMAIRRGMPENNIVSKEVKDSSIPYGFKYKIEK
ncbi:hypothetical protein [Carnobacterium maltaromaticum]|nr:hypothetical protein [Carnobacterium maltaromaticum]